MLRLQLMSTVVSPLRGVYNRVLGNYTINQWQRNGMPYPTPHVVKQAMLNHYREQYRLTTLVETGTYLGDMVDAQKTTFERIFSVELSPELARMAQQRFRRQSHIQILSGDSAKVLHQLMPTLTAPALFWLDGHYSGGVTAKGNTECPIFDELDAIFQHNQNHIILIDDARLFVGKQDYPTLTELSAYIAQRDNRYNVMVKDDIICVVL